MIVKQFAAPGKYSQGAGEISNFGKYVAAYGKKFFIIADEFVINMLSDQVRGSFDGTDINLKFEEFKGEITEEEISRLLKLFKSYGGDAIIGIGGGKVLDTAKVVASKAGVPIIVVPTIASTNAASSAGSVIYTDKGEFESVYRSVKNPDLVFVDTEIIAKAPVRMLVAGMGDAFAAYYEARACRASGADNLLKGKATNSAFAIVEKCDRILMDSGLDARNSVEAQIVTEALENVVEAILFMSGVGFESNGLAFAHALAKGFTTVPGHEDYYHGEWVAFGTLVQLILEKVPEAEMRRAVDFLYSVGLPMNLEDLGQGEITEAEFIKVSEIVAEIPSVKNMPFVVTALDIQAAIRLARTFGGSL